MQNKANKMLKNQKSLLQFMSLEGYKELNKAVADGRETAHSNVAPKSLLKNLTK